MADPAISDGGIPLFNEDGTPMLCKPGGGCCATLCNADYTWFPDCTDLSVDFTDASTPTPGETIVSWDWDFGDGGTSQLQNPSHTFGTFGTWNVELRTVDSVGCEGIVIYAVSTNVCIVTDCPAQNAQALLTVADIGSHQGCIDLGNEPCGCCKNCLNLNASYLLDRAFLQFPSCGWDNGPSFADWIDVQAGCFSTAGTGCFPFETRVSASFSGLRIVAGSPPTWRMAAQFELRSLTATTIIAGWLKNVVSWNPFLHTEFDVADRNPPGNSLECDVGLATVVGSVI